MGCIQGEIDTLSQAGSWVAGCSWQAGRPGRYSFGRGRLLVDTAGLPEADGAAAGRPGNLGLGLDQGQEPGRREVRSSETAAAEAVVGQVEELQAESYILLKEEGSLKGMPTRNGIVFFYNSAAASFFFLNRQISLLPGYCMLYCCCCGGAPGC